MDWFGATPTLKKWVATDVTTRRGAPPSLVEWLILAWVFGECMWSRELRYWCFEVVWCGFGRWSGLRGMRGVSEGGFGVCGVREGLYLVFV